MIVLCGNSIAAELFGIDLQTASLDQFRDAAKQAGAKLIREGGEDEWFDVYDSQKLLPGSSRLYLGYVKQSRKLAFAEYEFIGRQDPKMRQKLILKYGAAKIKAGKFVSDQQFHWQHQGTDIQFSYDWQNYRSSLRYINPTVLTNLLEERSKAKLADLVANAALY